MATKKQQAAAKLSEWNAQRPADYQNPYTPQIDQALAKMQGRSFGSGYNYASDPNYRQYAKQYTAAAQAAAENAAANTAALSGGYGSSYANSAAAQAYQDQMTGLNDILPALRAQALNGYNSETNSLESLLAGLQQQSRQAYSEYAGGMADWESMRDYLTGSYEQASAESQAFWNNVVGALKWALDTGVDVYDTYKGYKQQDLENRLMQQQLEDQWLGLYNQYMTAGNTQEASRYAERLGLDMEDWVSPGSDGMSLEDILSAQAGYQQALSLGDQQSAAALAELLGYDTSRMSLLPAAYAGYKSASGGTSGGTGTRQTTEAQRTYGNGLSYSDYMTAAKQLAALDEDSPSYSYLEQMYKGLLESPTAESGFETGVNEIYKYLNKGYNDRAIVTRLNHMGYTDEQIAAMMEYASK